MIRLPAKSEGSAGDLLFGNTGIGWWAGRWWWTPMTTSGGLTIALLPKAWKVSREVQIHLALEGKGISTRSLSQFWDTLRAGCYVKMGDTTIPHLAV